MESFVMSYLFSSLIFFRKPVEKIVKCQAWVIGDVFRRPVNVFVRKVDQMGNSEILGGRDRL